MKVRLITPAEMSERNARFRASGLSRVDFECAELEREGTALFVWWENGTSFTWCCPGCAHLHFGRIGEHPVSGWDEPRWVNTGTPEAPTLTPSLGCPGWKHGTCPEGHYWMRDGELVPA